MSLTPEPSESLYLGWNIGGTTCSIAVGTPAGRIIESASWPAQAAAGPEHMLKDFLMRALVLRERHSRLKAVGVSIGGPLDSRVGMIYSPPHLPGWTEIPLKARLTNELNLPVQVEHDAVACLIAEWLWGAAQGRTHAVYCTAGTGFGAGIMIAGKIVRGPSGQTTEIGHVRLADSGPRLYGKSGCIESFCSGTGIALLAREMYPKVFLEPTDTRDLCQQSEAGSVPAREVLNTAAKWTGRAYAILADLFSPQVIIAGSLARYLPAWWLTAVEAEFRREALPRNCLHTRVVAPLLGDKVQDLAAIGPCLFPYEQSPVNSPSTEPASATSL